MRINITTDTAGRSRPKTLCTDQSGLIDFIPRGGLRPDEYVFHAHDIDGRRVEVHITAKELYEAVGTLPLITVLRERFERNTNTQDPVKLIGFTYTLLEVVLGLSNSKIDVLSALPGERRE